RAISVRPRAGGDPAHEAKTGCPPEPVLGPAIGRTRVRARTERAILLPQIQLPHVHRHAAPLSWSWSICPASNCDGAGAAAGPALAINSFSRWMISVASRR